MKFILLLIFIIIHFQGFSQCFNFHNQCELPLDWPYSYSSQSLDADIIPGQSIKIKVIMNEGYDYYFGFCKSDDLGEISYQFITQDNETIIDQIDSKKYNNIEYVEISSASTVIVLISIKTFRGRSTNVDFKEKKCISIIIGNKQTEN